MLKPNLTTEDAPPVTTPVGIVEATYLYCHEQCTAEIAIGEGCGSGKTIDTLRANGYVDLAEKYGLRLIDLNTEETVLCKKTQAYFQISPRVYLSSKAENSRITYPLGVYKIRVC